MPTGGTSATTLSNLEKLLIEFDKKNESLRKLLDENARLNESIFEETGAERLEKLIEATDERNKEFKKIVTALNKDFKDDDRINFKFSTKHVEKDLKKLKTIIEEFQDEIDGMRASGASREEIREKQQQLQKYREAYNALQGSASDFYSAANEEQRELNKRQLEGTNILDDMGEKWEQRTRALRKGFGEIKDGAKKAFDGVTKTIEPWSKANSEAMAFAKSMGMSQKTADAYLNRTVSWAAKNDIGILFNKTTDELIKMQGKYSEVLGRNVQLTGEQAKDMLAMEAFLGEDGMTDIVNNLENFGMGMSDSASFIKETMDEATKTGVAASKLTKTIRENIKMAQNYTFKNGLEGLTNMAKKAIELKTDMSFVNSFLEKVSTVEGAITTGAQLQVLGGNYAMGSDPLSMMYESLNDVEGLFDRAVGMAKGKVFYNDKSGNFEMGAMDRYMMKQAATTMGVDPEKMIDVAFRQASLGRIEEQAKLNSNISGDADMMELVKNLATWENGKAVVNIDGKAREVSGLTSSDKEKLEAMQKTDSQNLQDMAISLRSMEAIMSGTEKEINNEQADIMKGVSEGINEMLRNNTGMLNTIAKIGAWFNVINGSWMLLSGILGVTTGILRSMHGVGNLFGRGTARGGRGRGGMVAGRGGGKLSFMESLKGKWRGRKGATLTSSSGNVYKSLGGGKLLNTTTGKVVTGAPAQRLIYGRTLGSGTSAATRAAGGAGRLGGGAIGGVAGAAVGGLAGAGISLVTDIATGEFKKDTGASVGRAVGAGVGAAIGSIFGPVGTMIGGFLGSAVTSGIQDAQKKHRAETRKNIANELAGSLPQVASLFEGENALQGNYNDSQLKSLKDALSDGVIDEGELNRSTLKKARANGDLIRMRDAGIQVKVAMAHGGQIPNLDEGTTIATPGQVQNYGQIKGPKHSSGGVPIPNTNIVVEGGEVVMSNEAVERYGLNTFYNMNKGTYNPYNFNGGVYNPYDFKEIEPVGKPVTVNKNIYQQNSMPQVSKLDISPTSINMSGTIKLDTGNKQVDITNELLKNPQFVRTLAARISKEYNTIEHGAYNKSQSLYGPYGA